MRRARRIRYPQVDDPEVQSLIVEIPAGGETGWHTHPVPAYAYILAGTIDTLQVPATVQAVLTDRKSVV